MIRLKPSTAYGHFNSYDLLKLIALATMIMDHLGAYLMPQHEWLRAAGRMAFPLFLFLVGYSGKWTFRWELLWWGSAIVLVSVLTHHHIFPFNILITITLTRLLMARIDRFEMTPRMLRGIFVACVVWFPLFYWCDYSTLAVLFAVAGLLQRRAPAARATVLFLGATLALYFSMQLVIFQFHVPALLWLLGVASATAYLMQHFCLKQLPESSFPLPVRHMLQWATRNTLPLYGLHVMLFMALERLWFPERVAHFHWF